MRLQSYFTETVAIFATRFTYCFPSSWYISYNFSSTTCNLNYRYLLALWYILLNPSYWSGFMIINAKTSKKVQYINTIIILVFTVLSHTISLSCTSSIKVSTVLQSDHGVSNTYRWFWYQIQASNYTLSFWHSDSDTWQT